MDQLPILETNTTILKRLSQLLSEVPQDLRNGLSINFRTRVKKVSEFFSSIEPEEILHELIEKTSATGPRKNWKYDETNYLIYIIDKYCLVHQINPDTLDAFDWEKI